MKCSACQYSNLPGSRFCEYCGAQFSTGSPFNSANPGAVARVSSTARVAQYPHVPATYSGGYTRTDPLASVGLVLGILGVIFFFSAPYGYLLSVPATVISAVAIYRINRDPGLGGSGMAKAGLALGIVGISLCTLFIIGCAASKSVVWHGGWWRTIGGVG